MIKRNAIKITPKSAKWLIALAVVVGLSGGLLLSIPTKRLTDSNSKTVEPKVANSKNDESSGSSSKTDQSRASNTADVIVLGRDRIGMNTDVIFALRVEDGQTLVTQIPRDSYIKSEEFGDMKINALMAYGGVETVIRALSRLMNRPMGNHIVVELDAIETLANMLGGINVDVPKRLYYVDTRQSLAIDLKPGPQLLKGKDLEGFLRWRNDEQGDLGRLDRQKLALQALIERIKEPQNLIRLPALALSVRELLDTDLSIMELGTLIASVSTTKLETTTLQSTPFKLDGISYLETEWPINSPTKDGTIEYLDN